MNYTLTDLPDSGKNPIVYMDISLKGEKIGRIHIRLFRDVFPAGVENFAKIASGKTYRVNKRGGPKFQYCQQTRRTYEGCKFYHFLHNNYAISGDIYANNGSKAGTIYEDQPIPANFGEYYYPHESKGLVSLIPYKDEASGKLFYDSTFMITLDDIKPTNILQNLDNDQIVIGHVYSGLDVLDKINQMIKPFAGRKYPEFIIDACNVYHKPEGNRRTRPIQLPQRRFATKPLNVIYVEAGIGNSNLTFRSSDKVEDGETQDTYTTDTYQTEAETCECSDCLDYME